MLATQHEANVQRLRDWIAAALDRARKPQYRRGRRVPGAAAARAGFQHVEIMPTDGKPGVFATLDAGAKKTLGVYFMYDVKQYDPAEWSSPPLEGRIVDMPNIGKVMMGRGAVNQKGPKPPSSPRCTRTRRPAASCR
jgi:acetylornithine deacetylase/succinyl-diaminopimelate desuccinylase-like protein